MPRVSFTKALKRFYPNLENNIYIKGTKISEILDEIEQKYPGIKDYIVEENGQLRKHVNIFCGEDPIDDRIALSDSVKEEDEVYIIQALSGG